MRFVLKIDRKLSVINTEVPKIQDVVGPKSTAFLLLPLGQTAGPN